MIGRDAKLVLRLAGIPVTHVHRSQETGEYRAEFYIPDMEKGVDPASVWAERILEKFPDVIITATHDTIAHWREGQPVIAAGVTFIEKKKEQE